MATAGTLAIDPKAGTHFTEKIFVTPHACDEATKDFGVERKLAPMFVMDNLRKAAYVSMVVNEDGRPSRLFAYRRMAIVVAPDTATVITVYPRHNANPAVLESVQKVLLRALKAAERKEKLAEKRITVEKAKLNVERAECDLRKAITQSLSVIDVMVAKINAIDSCVAALDRELLEVKREKTNLANSIVPFI
jgi:hypothetical protein